MLLTIAESQIGQFEYLDDNDNDIFDAGEQSAMTNAAGDYAFTDLIPTSYTVAEVAQSGWQQTFPAGNGTHSLGLASGQILSGIDFGNVQSAQIHGTKWNDVNANGMWDESESALEGWTIFLDEDNDGVLDAGELSTTTDSTGYYEFTALIPGTYTVVEVMQAGWERTYPGVDGVGDVLQTFGNQDPDADYSLYFGESLALLGDDVLVGAPPYNVHLFDGVTGQLLQTFSEPESAESDGDFGSSMAALGDKVLIGAPSPFLYTDSTGVVYLFDASTAELIRTFENPTPDAGDGFGAVVIAVGDNVLITAPGDDTFATGGGIAYLFNGTTGQLLQTFQAPAPEIYQAFGAAAAVLGNNVLISSPGSQGRTIVSDAVYLFDTTTGDLLQTYLNPVSYGPGFGAPVVVAGNDVLVGTAGYNSAQEVYLFDGVTGQLRQTFRPPAFVAWSNQSVTVVGDRILINVYYPNQGYEFGSPLIYVFDRTSGDLVQTLYGLQGSLYTQFGHAILPIGSNVLIGAPGSWEHPGYQAVYLFEPGSGPVEQTVFVGAGEIVDHVDFGNRLFLGDANRDGVVSADDYGSVQLNFGDTASTGLPGDANGDGVVSADDYGSVQLNFGNIVEVDLPGDANGDGVVSADDYGSVQSHFGDTGEAGIPGDANHDGVVSADDYGSVQANFGNMAGMGGMAGVFETTGLAELNNADVNWSSVPNHVAKGTWFYTPVTVKNRGNVAITSPPPGYFTTTLYYLTDDDFVTAAEGIPLRDGEYVVPRPRPEVHRLRISFVASGNNSIGVGGVHFLEFTNIPFHWVDGINHPTIINTFLSPS